MTSVTAPKFVALLTLTAVLGLVPFTGRAQTAGPSPDLPYPVVLEVGETFSVCKSGQIICPVVAPICDDPKVAIPVDTPDGLGFKAVGPGTTLCSAAVAFSSGVGLRRVFRITVLEPKEPKER